MRKKVEEVDWRNEGPARASAKSWLQLGGLVSMLSRFGVVSPRRVAAKGVMAEWVNVADQRAV